MKRFNLLPLITLSLALTVAITGCKTRPTGTTVIPGTRPNVGNAGPDNRAVESGIKFQPINVDTDARPGNGNDLPPRLPPGSDFEGNKDYAKFAAQTVHFDLDSSTIKKSEQPKLDEVAGYYKANPGQLLLIEGHCDERGTEGYNLALGDRRALALRTYLVNLGVSPESIHTVSFGEQKPVATGHSEAAWKQNRRGQFVLIVGK